MLAGGRENGWVFVLFSVGESASPIFLRARTPIQPVSKKQICVSLALHQKMGLKEIPQSLLVICEKNNEFTPLKQAIRVQLVAKRLLHGGALPPSFPSAAGSLIGPRTRQQASPPKVVWCTSGTEVLEMAWSPCGSLFFGSLLKQPKAKVTSAIDEARSPSCKL